VTTPSIEDYAEIAKRRKEIQIERDAASKPPEPQKCPGCNRVPSDCQCAYYD
jgi:hypothetical protein